MGNAEKLEGDSEGVLARLEGAGFVAGFRRRGDGVASSADDEAKVGMERSLSHNLHDHGTVHENERTKG